MAATHYDTLQVSSAADADVIRAAYKVLIKKYHPDRNPNKLAAEQCSKINGAYDILSDGSKRKTYDLTLSRSAPQSAGHQHNHQHSSAATKPYRYDAKWEEFLSKRPHWAKTIVVPPDAWGNTAEPMVSTFGMVDVRPDLHQWGQRIINVGRQYNIPKSQVESEVRRTWEYFCTSSGLSSILVQETVRAWVNRAFGHPENVSVKFGL
jgi:curved DNA-binding protein CbpA